MASLTFITLQWAEFHCNVSFGTTGFKPMRDFSTGLKGWLKAIHPSILPSIHPSIRSILLLYLSLFQAERSATIAYYCYLFSYVQRQLISQQWLSWWSWSPAFQDGDLACFIIFPIIFPIPCTGSSSFSPYELWYGYGQYSWLITIILLDPYYGRTINHIVSIRIIGQPSDHRQVMDSLKRKVAEVVAVGHGEAFLEQIGGGKNWWPYRVGPPR